MNVHLLSKVKIGHQGSDGLALGLRALLAAERALADLAAATGTTMKLLLARLVLAGTESHGKPQLLDDKEISGPRCRLRDP
jgi:hypothetical protein